MLHKWKQAWTVDKPTLRAGSFGQRLQAQKLRLNYKTERVRKLLAQGVTKDRFEERREAYFCMKEHPGRYCSECNPRAYQEDDADLSDEEGELSDSWSDGSSTSEGVHSPTYSYIWHQEEERLRVTEYIVNRIAIVDAAAARLEAAIDNQTSAKHPIGGLRGQWHLYNADVCPKRYEPTGEYYRLIVSQRATENTLVNEERIRYSPSEQFIQWDIKDTGGDIAPFQFPEHASLNPISITLMTTFDESVHAEIVFLGDDCLRLRVPRWTVYSEEPECIGSSASTVEFAGLRETEADIVERKRALKTAAEARSRANSPCGSVAAQLCGWDY